MSRWTTRRVASVAAMAVVVAAIAAGATGIVALGGNDTADADQDDEDTSRPIDTATIARGDLTADHDFRGTVGFGDQWEIPLGSGVVTASQPIGTLVGFGQSLVTIDDLPVLLFEGEVPMYRDLEYTSTPMAGADVAQLQQMLIGAGFDREGKLVVDGIFGRETKRAVEDWQVANWRPKTGRVSAHEIVFSPVPLRIASEERVGTAFDGIEVTEWEPRITVAIPNRDRTLLPVGANVSLELDDGSSTTGIVVEQLSVTADDGSTSTRVTIEPESVTGGAASARVVVTNTVATDVLLAPVGALLAVAEGGYALEVIERPGGLPEATDRATDDVRTRLVGVEVGAILDGRAEVTGAVEAGDEVVVAS